MKALIFLITILFTLKTFSSESVFKIKYGVSLEPNTEKILNDTYRAIEIGYFSGLNKSLSWSINGGYYGDKSIDLNTWYTCAQFGTELKPFKFFYVDQYFGPCYFGAREMNLINGHIQFQTSTGIGWRDGTGSQIGMNLIHFSSGGLSAPLPNTGVNLLMLNMSFGL
jgi:hypothetical protein